jgi:IS4 transposase
MGTGQIKSKLICPLPFCSRQRHLEHDGVQLGGRVADGFQERQQARVILERPEPGIEQDVSGNTAQDYPEQLRRIRFKDPESGKTLVFLTNNTALPALTIAALYKSRWQVELFFKWIKQHLRIKRFIGTPRMR